MTKYRLTTLILDQSLPPDAVSLVLPVPPSTADQRSIGMLLPCHWKHQELQATNVPQSALFVDVDSLVSSDSFAVDITIPDGQVTNSHFEPHDIACFKPRPDALDVYHGHDFSSMTEATRLTEIVRCVANKFHYQHGVNSDLPLTCDLLTGNCLDINTAFIQLLRAGNIKNAYYIGYFFRADQPLVNDDWHCWVDTLSSQGYENWDIAHYLKQDLTEIAPALNPIPGMRFAMSTGRDLLFERDFATVRFAHLCEPRWLLKDGSSRQCNISVAAEPS